jgi:hypothetical protein
MRRSVQQAALLTLAFLGMALMMSNILEAGGRVSEVRELRIAANDKLVEIQAVDVDSQVAKPVLKYWRQKPTDTKLAAESGCFFHPLCTPDGVAVTDLAPADHPHHRGVFLAFVEMRGAKLDADFWGWGVHAPVEGRKIENIDKAIAELDAKAVTTTFDNAWKVGDEVFLDERLSARTQTLSEANVLDLEYRLTPREDIRLPRWAFSGFCVRLRKDGKIVYTSPNGVVDRPALNHLKPELDWPAEAWYDATVTLADGKQVGVAVVDHPKNPPCLWHNEKNIHMINPCIVAPGEVKLTAGKPLVLSYRLVVHDGPAPVELVEKLAKEYRDAKNDSKQP